ncbi:MAG: complex I subunit 5 family protein [Nitriliruptoraceae bacterium]
MGLSLTVLALPAIGALTAFLAPRWRPAIALMATTATVVASLLLVRDVLARGATTVRIGREQLAAVLVVDGLSAGLVLLASGVALTAMLFAATQRSVPGTLPRGYWPLAQLLLVGLHGLFLAGDLLTAYLMLELVAVTGAVLVAAGGGRARLVAGTRYFYAELIASVTFLAGTALVWSLAGTVVIAELPGRLGAGVPAMLALTLLTIGLLLKVPVVPLHFWLPAAHTLAPSAVSPLLSTLVVKSAFAVLLRLWGAGIPALTGDAVAQLLGALGAVAVVWGGLSALRATKVKVVIAYSTVAQLGLLLLAVPMVVAGSHEAWLGAVVHAIAHALPKAAALLAVALLAHHLGGDTVDHLEGAAVRRPLAAFALGVAAVSLIGLPPTGGFVAKWYLVVASITTGQWWWAATIVLGSLLTGAYLARLLQRGFAAVPTAVPQARPRGRSGDVLALALASSGLVLGLYPDRLVALLEVGAPLALGTGGMAHG